MKKSLFLILLFPILLSSQTLMKTGFKSDDAWVFTAGESLKVNARLWVKGTFKADSQVILGSPLERAYSNAKLSLLNGLSDSSITLRIDTTSTSGAPVFSALSPNIDLRLPFTRMKSIGWITGLQDTISRHTDTLLSHNDRINLKLNSSDTTVFRSWSDLRYWQKSILDTTNLHFVKLANKLNISDSTIVSAGTYITALYVGHTVTVNVDTTKTFNKLVSNVVTGSNIFTARQYLTSEAVDTLVAKSSGNKVYIQDTIVVNGAGKFYDSNGDLRIKISSATGNVAKVTMFNTEGYELSFETGDEYIQMSNSFYIRNQSIVNPALSVNGWTGQTQPLIEAVQEATTVLAVMPTGKVDIGESVADSMLTVKQGGHFEGGLVVGTGFSLGTLNPSTIPYHLTDATGLTNSPITISVGGNATTFADTVNATVGVFSGALSGTTGTFSSSISATSLNLSNNFLIGTAASASTNIIQGATPYFVIKNNSETTFGIVLYDLQDTTQRGFFSYGAGDNLTTLGNSTVTSVQLDNSGNVILGATSGAVYPNTTGAIDLGLAPTAGNKEWDSLYVQDIKVSGGVSVTGAGSFGALSGTTITGTSTLTISGTGAHSIATSGNSFEVWRDGGASTTALRSHGTTSSGSYLLLARTAGTRASQTDITTSDMVGTIGWWGRINSAERNMALLQAYADGTVSSTSYPASMRIQLVADGATALTTRFIFQQNGALTLGSSTGTGTGALYSGAMTATGNITTVDDTLHIGNPSNYVSIDSANALRLYGNSTVWEDLQVPLIQSKLGVLTKPDFDYDSVAYMFPQNDTTEIIYATAQLPHSWKEGSTIYPHIHVQQSKNQQATFKVVYKWVNMGSAVPSTWSQVTLGTYVYTYTSGRLHQLLTTTSGISGAGQTISSILLMKIYRSDNVYSGDIAAYTLDLHHEKDALGSKSIDAK